MKPTIVCLCGSTRFREEFRAVNAQFTLDGVVVLSVGCFQGDPEWGEKSKPGLDELHLRKIDMADEVFVINVGGYIGLSTRREIEYATKIGKPIYYMEPL